MMPIDQIRSFEILSPEEQQRLLATGTVEDRNKVIESLLRFARLLAQRAAQKDPAVEIGDLLNYAVLGLIEAAGRYDPDHGTKFTTYASWWMRREIFRYFETRGIVRVPKKAFSDGWRARMCGIDDLIQVARGGDSFGSIADTLRDPRESPEARLARRSEWDQLYSAVSDLPRQMQTVILRRYWKGENLRQIGDALGLTKERIRQVQAEAEAKLRIRLGRRVAWRPRGTE